MVTRELIDNKLVDLTELIRGAIIFTTHIGNYNLSVELAKLISIYQTIPKELDGNPNLIEVATSITKIENSVIELLTKCKPFVASA